MEGPARGAFFFCDMSAIQKIFKGFERESGEPHAGEPIENLLLLHL
jgi:hypothetical protein